MSYAEEIKSKNLESFKSIPWRTGKKVALVKPAPNSNDGQGSLTQENSAFSDQQVTAFRDSVNWLGNSAERPMPASDNSAEQAQYENNDEADDNGLTTDEDLFSAPSGDDDFGIEAFEETDEPHSEFFTPQSERYIPQQAPKLLIRSSTRSDVYDSDDVHQSQSEVDNDLQKVAVVLLSRKNTTTIVKYLAIALVVLSGFGLWSDYSKLGLAQKSSNPDALRTYLDSQYLHIWDTDIRLRLNEIENASYQEAIADSSMAGYKRYLRDFPNGRYFNEVLDSLSITNASNHSGEVQ